MKRVYKIIIAVQLATMALLPLTTLAQQDPMYTQYMFNTQTINPAYAGSWESIGFLALSRMQWVGMSGAPITNTFSFQAPTRNLKFGYGLNVIQDRIGFEKRFSVYGDYAYQIAFNEKTSLRMGLKGGFTNYSHNLEAHTLYPGEASDPLFQGNLERKFLPNFGVGFWLSSDKYYLGLSSPKILNSKITDNESNFSVYGEFRHFFLIGGLVLDLSENVKFKPTFLTKATIGAPVEFDLSANFLFKEKFWLGGMYRSGDAVGFSVQWVIDRNLRLGYAYDYSFTNMRKHHFNTHEIMISYEMKFERQTVVSPRYF